MANRSYLYSLSNRPTSYADRPETISGLSEWPYEVPFSYRVLMSGDPQLCSSLVSDGFENDAADSKTRIYAISADFKIGFARLKKFIATVRLLAIGNSPDLVEGLDETIEFLENHQDDYLLLETIELDCMTESGEAALRASVEMEIESCHQVGAAIDALPDDPTEAAKILKAATEMASEPLLSAFYGLMINDDFDDGGETDYPMGLYWDEVLYFELWNREEFETHQ